MKNTEEPIVVEQSFDSSVENVWDAITVYNKMIKWFFPNLPSFEPVVGFETRFVVQNEGRIFPHLWKLTEVIPMKKIIYDWRYEGYPGRSVVIFELMEEGNKTKLKLTSKVLEDFPDHIPEFKRESGVEGWSYLIQKSLKEYIEENVK
ncbi:SRPBCC family protein, partial [Xanthovirga aplysinae]|uniref:SRPBCC family protein n=1 Tax=Xanthovirga aplysinae TaxID=2529853 RepID=UPI0012BB5282